MRSLLDFNAQKIIKVTKVFERKFKVEFGDNVMKPGLERLARMMSYTHTQEGILYAHLKNK